ncbi:MAG: response regulator transcription factor [Nitriliruptorales bacterium]|nr:response regulator transcription factor [Nitriliruptorales bacterium]
MTRVMLVDDHRLVREGLRRTLEDAGMEVVGEARDGAEAVEIVDDVHPDVVLMDVSMPVLDGITATRRMRTRAPEAKVVILTMHADTDLLEKARSAGAVGYLIKDASSDEVVAAVERAVEGHHVISTGIADHAPLDEPGSEETSGAPVPELTPRELQILQLLADGLSPKEVADELVISPKTVRNHLSKAYDKLDVSSRSQALVAALSHGLIDLPD